MNNWAKATHAVSTSGYQNVYCVNCFIEPAAFIKRFDKFLFVIRVVHLPPSRRGQGKDLPFLLRELFSINYENN
jgi:hypothetical protein